MDKLIYLFLTQLTIVIHLLFIVFIIVGGFFARKRVWLKIIHLCAVMWAIYVELAPGIICPLTALENYFGYRAGLSTYEDDFVARYLIPIIYPEGLTVSIQYILAGIVIFINIIAYKVIPIGKQNQR